MEVNVRNITGVPEGCIISIRAGPVRRQGVLATDRPIKFATSRIDANPFSVDLYAPIASARLTLMPSAENYNVQFTPNNGKPGMKIDLEVKESGGDDKSDQGPRQARQERREQNASVCEDYITKHKLVQFVQNLMQSVLVEQPEDPFSYMEQQLRMAKGGEVPAPAPPPPGATPKKKKVVEAPKKDFEAVPKTFDGPAFTVQSAAGVLGAPRPLQASDVMLLGSQLRKLRVENLSDTFASAQVPTTLRGMMHKFQNSKSLVTQTLATSGKKKSYYQMLRAGPHEILHFNPSEVTATIVTCGGLCPGLNAVVRQVAKMLFAYGVTKVYGILGGYKGVVKPEKWVEITPAYVQDIHDLGGTVLSSDRGNPPVEEQAEALKKMGVNCHFVIGGDGTHRGAYDTYTAMKKFGHECAVVGIPKTIDNDVPMLDRTFGFDTACTEAAKAIHAAYVEATCNANCIGLVKLMGRHCGYIAMNACLAARHVDICILPEMEVDCNKVLNHALHLMQTKGYAVIVVAEGCGNTLIKSSGETDAGGNVKLADVGPWLRDKILAKFKEVKLPLTIKYIDPTYMIRAVKPNANDSVYCATLADHAVHAAMAGYTGVTIGKICERYVTLPIQAITQQPPRKVELKGKWFIRLISTTLQPDLRPDDYVMPEEADAEQDIQALMDCSEPVDLRSALANDGEVRRLEVEHLKEAFGEKSLPTTVEESVQGAQLQFIEEDDYSTQTLGRSHSQVSLQMLQAGPRKSLYFEPKEVAAAIVTCGGLCPGLNSVIREVVMMLYSYGVRKVYGIKGGYKGVINPKTWMTLTPDNVKDIHMQGGTVLVADRGNPPPEQMAEVLRSKGVKQYFVLGGDGTHRGAYATYEAMKSIAWQCSVVGVPKTIDNDIAILDQTFGFETASTEAEKAIDTAYVEATCNANCIGLVKLMGRHCGYLTMMAVLAARHVDICLLPEMDVDLNKVLDYAVHLLKKQGHAVIVVAEGCGDTLIQGSGETDAGGNKKLADAGLFLKDAINAHFKNLKLPLTIKYVDPTYMVRAIPANAYDSIYCSTLAHGAVHAAMAGYTGVTVAKVDESFVYLPIRAITNTPNRKVDIGGRWYERLLATTHQPDLGASGFSTATPVDPSLPYVENRHRLMKARSSFKDLNDPIRVPNVSLTKVDGYGENKVSQPLERSDLLMDDNQIRMLKCFHLSERFGAFQIPSPLKSSLISGFSDAFSWTTQSMTTAYRMETAKNEPYYHMVRAGPREQLHFDPNDPAACAAIVSCGGICPGLNSVIREVVLTLWAYGVRRIYGIKGGFKGVVEPENWIKLTPEVVQDIHNQGGTILVSDRGNPAPEDMAKVLKEKGVRQYFVLGGDGTHKGAMQSFNACLEVDHECSVIGVPKTIDNDVPLLDQTFGFDTACTEAVRAVDSAYVEATCNANCIGLVKLMGRHCGFIALYAALAARHADIVLLPEMAIDVEKVLQHCVHLMKTQKYAVVVVAEGCGDTIIQGSGETDAGGNKLLADVGLWLKGQITARFKQEKMPLTIKYIDPTYMIRSIPANSWDSTYCATLAQNAVHGAMAGYSGITVGKVYDRYVYLPIYAITMQKGRRVNPGGRWFQRLRETTLQPDFTPASVEPPPATPANKEHVLEKLSTLGSINEVLHTGDEFVRLECVNLGQKYASANHRSSLEYLTDDLYLDSDSWTTQTLMRMNKRDDHGHVYHQMLRGGPRRNLHFDPAKSSAVIVTCGGLCPGLNSVIRELVMTLTSYGVTRIYGCKGGFKGMVETEKWMQLTPEVVRNVHNQGGTILVSDRGNPPPIEIANSLKNMNITQYFVIGGDGTHRGAMAAFKATQEIDHECAVVGVPKTIDNDIPILDRSFGYKTACTEAAKAIHSAYVEASSNSNCIGLVKLMGRHCGWIALEATISSRFVDICLLPEMDISLPKVLTQALHLLKTKGYAVIVVAEGCGDTLIKSAGDRDAGGNKKLADVGPWLQAQLSEFFNTMQERLTIKYIDPTYTIRAVPANANDSVYCSLLASQAVHGAMAGYSGITVGKVDERYVMLPIHAITTGTHKVDLKSRIYERMLFTTGQPNLAPSGGDDWALMPPPPKLRRAASISIKNPEVDTLEFKGLRSTSTVSTTTEFDPTTTIKVFGGLGEEKEQRIVQANDLIQPGAEIRRLEVMHLSDKFTSKNVPTPFKELKTGYVENSCWTSEALSMSERVDSVSQAFFQFLRAGPRETLHFDPKDRSACAAIITSGGLCPGENSAIREITRTLFMYGVERVYGISNGFKGVVDDKAWRELNPEIVKDIHQKGGTILKNTRGNPAMTEVAAALKAKNVRQFFAIGGEGTHKGILQCFTACLSIGHECACLVVPATINNDVQFLDRSIGFDTACTVARDSIDAAYVEATCNANCIGLVKLTGADNGFLGLEAVLASRHVDIAMLPEAEIEFTKVLDHCMHLMSTKGYAVVVVADGCKDQLLRKAGEESTAQVDVGVWVRDKILAHFKAQSRTLTIKYIDPTYQVRAVKANAFDSVYASALAENAVHGAMAGYTGVTSAMVYNRYVYVPLQAVSQTPSKFVNPRGRWFARLLFTTKQPHFEPDGWTYPSGEDAGEKLKSMSTELSVAAAVPPATEIRRLEVTNLTDTFTTKNVDTPLKTTALKSSAKMFIKENSWTSQSIGFLGPKEPQVKTVLQLLRAGPRETLHFDTSEEGASAAIVTCGGLCPGLNAVIRELANMLRAYGVKQIWGIIGGYNGCVKDEEWISLTEQVVQNVHMQGGSILVSDRGNPPHSEIAKVMQRKKVRQFFVLGGDGTHRGALAIFKEMTAIGHECAVVGVPKTIDNDIPVLDRSFGYDTACTEAERAISSAYVEATTNANCIGLVKLMGRHCGWIAAMATLANRHVDVCLLPEMNISLPKLLDYVASVMRRKRYAVIVVAEGCGDTIISAEGGTDAGGNKVLADVGPYIKEQITAHCKAQKIPITIKYIDPTYMIRSVAANAYDSKYCAALAQEAVHGAMAGYTGITVGKVDERYVMLPIHAIANTRKVDLNSKIFEELMSTTEQPSFDP